MKNSAAGGRLWRPLLCLVCALSVYAVWVGCSNTSALGQAQTGSAEREAIDPIVIEIIKKHSEQLGKLRETYKETESPDFSDEILLKQHVKESEVKEDALSQLVPRMWNFIKLDQSEMFTKDRGEYDLSLWKDVQSKLTIHHFRFQAMERYLRSRGYDQ